MIRREEYLFSDVVATLFIYSIYLFTIFVLQMMIKLENCILVLRQGYVGNSR
ncbi:hypothetical protein SAMN02745781_00254 [Vibrio gazogenes DSM 21264]|uniref:Uncharacterized protein n=1 Tax=Vibrio gazogenes DSM 21264 = NBRC 103151 TaxID=1123492 RepID=A0A1M4T7I6_VIBGA|nr:hypothetical protein SAMN02745781_00254 [Vibrio gazogenes DSM 21264] [Vibrio gazogenes DSM 21264 = NBRC 103151]